MHDDGSSTVVDRQTRVLDAIADRVFMGRVVVACVRHEPRQIDALVHGGIAVGRFDRHAETARSACQLCRLRGWIFSASWREPLLPGLRRLRLGCGGMFAGQTCGGPPRWDGPPTPTGYRSLAASRIDDERADDRHLPVVLVDELNIEVRLGSVPAVRGGVVESVIRVACDRRGTRLA